jgi:hypothetical protein
MLMLKISLSVEFPPTKIAKGIRGEQHDDIDCTHCERVHFICKIECDLKVVQRGAEAAIVCRQSNGDGRDANDKGEYAHTRNCEPERHNGRR